MKTFAPFNKSMLLSAVFYYAIAIVFGLAIIFLNAKAFVIGLVAFLLLIVVAIYPEIGLLYFAIGFDSFGYIGNLFNIPFGIRSFVFAIGLLYILCIFIFFRRKDLSCLVDKTLFTAILLGVLIAVNALLRPYHELGMWKAQGYLLFNLFTMVAAILFSNEPLAQRRMIYASVFGCLISNVSLYFLANTPASIEFGRFVAGYSNPIWLSRTISVLIIANLVVFAAYKNKWLRLCLVVSSLVGIYFMLMTGSRGPLISFVFTLISFFLISSEITFKKKAFIITCIIACFFMTSLMVQDEVTRYRYASLVMVEYEQYDYRSQAERLEMYEDAIRQFFSNPVLGMGTTGGYPHNIVLEIASEWGSIGLLIFLYFAITTARVTATLLPKNILNLCKDEMFKTWAAMCFICALLNSLVSGSIATNSLIWFASGCLIAARNTVIE